MNPLDEFATLKTLDPATRDPDPHTPRAQASLERILATDPSYDVRPRRARRRVARVVAATGALAIAATVAFVAVTAGGDPAYATWTGQPSGLTASERAAATAECRDQRKEGSPDYADQLNHAGTAIAERRGDWTLVILAGRDGFSALCITDAGKPLFASNFGSIGTGGGTPGARELRAIGLGYGSIDNHDLSVATGTAGADVEAVSYRSATRGTVEATVSGGHFAFWLPGRELDGPRPVPVQVTYRDGTTATVGLKL